MTVATHNDLRVLGLSYRTAPAAVREALSFSSEQAVALLREAAAADPGLEAAVLSTCMRCEFYLVVNSEDSVGRFLALLRRARPDAPVLRDDCLRYRRQDADAARHLLRVAAGLDSAILGDMQVGRQVRAAQEDAALAGTLGPHLARLFTRATGLAKRARRDTDIARGSAGVGSAIAGMVQDRRERLGPAGQLRMLLLGAGDVAHDAARHLVKRKLGSLIVVNRTAPRAKELAESIGACSAPWENLAELVQASDVVICATSSPQPVLTAQQVGGSNALLIDAGMPRNVDPAASSHIIDIDAIRDRHREGLARRQRAIPTVEAFVEDELGRWRQWRAARPLEDRIKGLYVAAANHSRQAAQALDALSPHEAERLLFRSFRHLLHDHVSWLRSLGPVPAEC